MGYVSFGIARTNRWLLAVVLAVTGALVAVPGAQASTTGTVTGLVLKPDGTPAGGVRVEVLDTEWTEPARAVATTARDGTYEFAGLEPGNLLFRFVDPSGDHLWSMHLGDVEWPDKPWLATATAVEAGAVVRVDHTLVRSGSVRGRLTLPADVDPSDLSIVAFHPRPVMRMAPRVPAQWARIEADGTFVMPLKPGTYVVDISHPDDLVRMSHHSVTVHGTDVTNLDVTPQRSGSISGVVNVPTGHEGEDVEITALVQEQDGRWRSFDAGTIARAGEPYRLSGLATGRYRLRFAPAQGSSVLAASHWPAAPQVREARDVYVVEGQDVSGKDGELVVGGVVEGRVDPSMGIEPGSTQVELRLDVSSEVDGTPIWDQGVASVDFEEDGRYRLVGVPEGNYRLAVVALKDVIEVFHPAARTIEASAEVVVAHGWVTAGVDVARPPAEAAEPNPEPNPEPSPEPSPEPNPKVITMRKAPKVSGKPRVGRTVKVTRGTWKPRKVTVKFQWQMKKGKKAVAVPKGKKAKLKLTKKLRKKRVRVRVTVTAKGRQPVVFTSRWLRKVA